MDKEEFSVFSTNTWNLITQWNTFYNQQKKCINVSFPPNVKLLTSSRYHVSLPWCQRCASLPSLYSLYSLYGGSDLHLCSPSFENEIRASAVSQWNWPLSKTMSTLCVTTILMWGVRPNTLVSVHLLWKSGPVSQWKTDKSILLGRKISSTGLELLSIWCRVPHCQRKKQNLASISCDVFHIISRKLHP